MSKPVNGDPAKDVEMTNLLDKLESLITDDGMNNYKEEICDRMHDVSQKMAKQGYKYGKIRVKQAWKGKNTKPIGKDKIKVSYIDHIKPCPQKWIDDIQDLKGTASVKVGCDVPDNPQRGYRDDVKTEPWIGD